MRKIISRRKRENFRIFIDAIDKMPAPENFGITSKSLRIVQCLIHSFLQMLVKK